MPVQTLSTQYISRATWETKIRSSIYGLAMADALGAPGEFQQRGSFPVITEMLPNGNFGLGPGVWTDDTSMALCLARSIGTCKRKEKKGLFLSTTVVGGFDELHQMEMYRRWREAGILSATGRCFDVGGTVGKAIKMYAQEGKKAMDKIQKEMVADKFCGNGSLMRVVPIGLAYWKDAKTAMEYGGRSSTVTHPNDLCVEVCEVWTGAIAKIMQAGVGPQADQDNKLSKFDLLLYFSSFPYRNSALTNALSYPPPTHSPSQPPAEATFENLLRDYPLLKLIQKVDAREASAKPPNPKLPTATELPSTGYVVQTLVSALYCFFATDTYEAGAILAANLGDDADTVGAVYGGLAGCWYGLAEAEDKGGAFWSKRVKKWKANMIRTDIIDEVLDELIGYACKST